jgi:hypothetical protein
MRKKKGKNSIARICLRNCTRVLKRAREIVSIKQYKTIEAKELQNDFDRD